MVLSYIGLIKTTFSVQSSCIFMLRSGPLFTKKSMNKICLSNLLATITHHCLRKLDGAPRKKCDFSRQCPFTVDRFTRKSYQWV